MKKILTKLVLNIFFALFLATAQSPYVYALSVETHDAINDKIVKENMNGFSLDTYLKNTIGIADGINTYFVGSGVNYKVYDWFKKGGRYEDAPPEYSIAYRRSRNHFLNPLLPWNQAYYTDRLAFCDESDNPFFVSGHCPASAILWALGPQHSPDLAWNGMIDLNPGGDWSWQKTRLNFYSALTSSSTSSRDASFADTYRGSTWFFERTTPCCWARCRHDGTSQQT